MENEITSYVKFLMEDHKSDHTIRSYVKDILKLVSYFQLKSPADLESISVKQYHDFYQSQELNAVSKNGLIRNLSAFFSWLESLELISKDNSFKRVVFGKSKFLKEEIKYASVLNEEEKVAIVLAGRNLQEKLMVSMQLRTALRAGEMKKIKLSDIDGCRIAIRGKGDKPDYTYLDDETCKLLSDYISYERKTNSEYLFYGTRGNKSNDGSISTVSINNRVVECCKIAGIERRTSHILRATKITETALKKGSTAAQFVARHASSETTKRYTRPNEQMMKDLILG